MWDVDGTEERVKERHHLHQYIGELLYMMRVGLRGVT